MNKAAFKYLAALSLGLISSCQYLADIGPVDIDKKPKKGEAPRNYKVMDINSSNISRYNNPHKSGGFSSPKADLSKTYKDTITSRDTLKLLVIDPRQGGMVPGSLEMGPFEVASDGSISVPHIGEMQVAGKSLRAVEFEIQEKYTTISESSQVSLSRVKRLNLRANIVGLVKTPGQQTIDRKGVTLTDLVARAGGTITEPYLCQYNLHRDGKTFKLSNDQINKKKLVLQDGDLLEVTKSQDFYVSVFGTAGRQTNQPFTSSHTHLTDILAESGGLNGRSSNASGVFVLRLKPGSKHHIYRFNMKSAEGLIAARQFHVQGRDILYITEAPLSRWNRAVKDFLSLSDVSALANISRVGN